MSNLVVSSELDTILMPLEGRKLDYLDSLLISSKNEQYFSVDVATGGMRF